MNKIIIQCALLFLSMNAYALTTQQKTFKKLYAQALKGDTSAVTLGKKQLVGYRLNHYLDYALLSSKMSQLPIKEIEKFKQKHKNSPLNKSLNQKLVYELGKQKKWKLYLPRYKNNKSSQTKHCWYLQARIETKDKKGLIPAITETWMNGLSLPRACDTVFEWWQKQGHLTDDLLAQRIRLSFKVNNASTARFLAAKMKIKPKWVDNALKLMSQPITTLELSTAWQDNSDNQFIVYTMAKNLAKKKPDEMYVIWSKLKQHFTFSSNQVNTVERNIALFAATDYLPFTIKAMNALPKAQHDAQIFAWKVRFYLYHQNWQEVAKTIALMPDFQQKKDNWQYWLARSKAKTGDQTQAKVIFSKLAKKSNYHGFLAADHMQLPYQICSKDIDSQPIDKMPENLTNAFELFAMDMISHARKEWIIGYQKLSIAQRRALADIAYQKGWYNKVSAIMGALGLWKNYKLRYPLAYQKEITRLSKQYNMLPQWIMSIITQESAWQTDAISRADARGLMQIIHPTAQRLSKKLGLSYSGKSQLHDAHFNLHLGIYYQSILFDQFGDHPLLALASYNAGESKAEDWLVDFPSAPDIWAETIPYIETRGYIAKILTNITIYDWLINQSPKRIASWMPTFPINGSSMKNWPNDKVSQQRATVRCDL